MRSTGSCYICDKLSSFFRFEEEGNRSASNSRTFASGLRKNINQDKNITTMMEIEEKSNTSILSNKVDGKLSFRKPDGKSEAISTLSTFPQTSGTNQLNKLLPPILDMSTLVGTSVATQKRKEPENLQNLPSQQLADLIDLNNLPVKSLNPPKFVEEDPKIGNFTVGKRGPNSFGALLQDREAKRMLINNGGVQIFQTRNTANTQKLLSKYLSNVGK